MMEFCLYDSPIGRLYIEADRKSIRAVRMADCADTVHAHHDSPLLLTAIGQLDAYFSGIRSSFDLPLELAGTPFERMVWTELLAIKHGEIKTYKEIAASIGRPGAARAVGRACGANPVLILVPCHRVLGAGGKLTGFAAGMEAKRFLLNLEGYCIINDRIKMEK